MSSGSPVDALVGLRDYHAPDALHWWPPAPGWWLLAMLAAAALLVVWLLRRRRRRRTGVSYLALAELSRLRARWREDADDLAFARALSQLLRRYVLASCPADDAAGLSGDAWLAYLVAKCTDAPATVRDALRGPLGRALVDWPYRPPAAVAAAGIDTPALADAADALIRSGFRTVGASSAAGRR